MSDLTVQEAKRYGIFSCTAELPLSKAARQMVTEDISCLVVIDSEGYLQGIITRTDLLRAWLSGVEWETTPVEEAMNSQVYTVSPHDLIHDVAQILTENQIHRVVIVQKDHDKLRPLGVISDADLVYHLAKDQ